MKIIVIGGHGTLGSTVVEHLSKKHEVLTAGRSKGDVQVDLKDTASIKAMFEKIGKVDAIVCTAGEAKWANFDDLSEADFYIGIHSKLMGQVNLVRLGRDYLNPNGSVTLTTGILADDPVRMTASAAMVNGGIHSFVQAVALELRDIRVNVVSPGLVAASAVKYADYFPGYTAIAMDKMARGYIRSVEGADTGKIIRIYE